MYLYSRYDSAVIEPENASKKITLPQLNCVPSIEEAVRRIDTNKTGSINGKEIIEKMESPDPDFALKAPSIVVVQASASPPVTDVIKKSSGSLISICIKKIKRALSSN